MSFDELRRESQETELRYLRFAEDRGWRESSGRICLLPVRGRRCRLGRGPEECACQRWRWPLDHARRWITEGGETVVTGEPYDLDETRVAELIREIRDELGLAVRWERDSPHYPGHTSLLVFSRS